MGLLTESFYIPYHAIHSIELFVVSDQKCYIKVDSEKLRFSFIIKTSQPGCIDNVGKQSLWYIISTSRRDDTILISKDSINNPSISSLEIVPS